MKTILFLFAMLVFTTAKSQTGDSLKYNNKIARTMTRNVELSADTASFTIVSNGKQKQADNTKHFIKMKNSHIIFLVNDDNTAQPADIRGHKWTKTVLANGSHPRGKLTLVLFSCSHCGQSIKMTEIILPWATEYTITP